MSTATRPYTVWLASYPKSGNTWARAVLGALARPHGSGPEVDINELDGGPIGSSRTGIDHRLGFASSDLLPEEIDALRPACDAAFDAELSRPRIRKIHDALFTGPDATPIVPPAATRAAIYLIRDPRDVAVSMAHFTARPLATVVSGMADGQMALSGGGRALNVQVRQRLDTWSRHVAGWTGHRLFPVAVFRYEDLRADPVGEFARMATASGLDAGRDEVAAAVAAADFERLRAQETECGFRERPRATSTFFRRGAVGAWRDELPTDLVRRIEADHGPMMARFGYPRADP